MLPEPNSFQTVGWICLALFGIAGGLNNLLKLWDRCKELPPPAQTYVAKSDCLAARAELHKRVERVEADLHEIRAEMKRDRDAILRAGEERAVKLHERINAVLAAVSELKGRTHYELDPRA